MASTASSSSRTFDESIYSGISQVCNYIDRISIGYTPSPRGVQPACMMTTQNSKIRLINSILP